MIMTSPLPIFVSHIFPIKGSNDPATLKLISKRSLTMKPAEAISFTYNNCYYWLRCGIGPAQPKFSVETAGSKIIQAFVICGKQPSPDDFCRAINKIVIQEIHNS